MVSRLMCGEVLDKGRQMTLGMCRVCRSLGISVMLIFDVMSEMRAVAPWIAAWMLGLNLVVV